MNAVIDYGNTSCKVGIFEKEKLHEKYSFKTIERVEDFFKNFLPEHVIISSVNMNPAAILGAVNCTGKKFVLTTDLPLPLKNLYESKNTLGVDRLAGVAAAAMLYPQHNILVLDAGTCITYDFIDADTNYHGGAISPGLLMRFKAMNNFTARLPLVEPAQHPELIGRDTIACMQSGVVNGLIAELDGIIGRYSEKFKDLKVILCGGDAAFFENQLKASIFAVPELVLSGLNSILLYNVKL
jgi:type III pantothenate kinase